MDYLILALLFLLSGFFMKFSDDLFDVNGDIKFASLLCILCGIASGFAAVYDIGAAYIFISIPIPPSSLTIFPAFSIASSL